MNTNKSASVIVLYQPDWDLLDQVVDAISEQSQETLVIDNSPVDNEMLFKARFERFDHIRYRWLGGNFGIAYAQNRGIEDAKALGCAFVIFFDQDSIPDKTMVESLKDKFLFLEQQGIQVGIVGPRASSRATDQPYKAKFATGKDVFSGVTEIQQLISSGSLIKVSTFDEVGLFEERLFIDIVDFEWCWRAHYVHGFKHFIIEDTVLSHMFGEKEQRVLGFRITVPTAFRIYYQFRNYVVLLRRKYVPLYWKVSNGVKLSVKFVLFPVICDNKSEYLRRSIAGIREGLRYGK